MRISREGVSLLVDFEIAAGERAQSLRLAFDRNHDGRLDPGEQAALLENLARTATLRTQLFLDGGAAALERRSVRGEKLDQPASSDALLAVRVELSAPWPPAGFWRRVFGTARRLELDDVDETGHVPVTAECIGCRVSEASSGVADGNLVRGANTPLSLAVQL